MEMDAGDHVKNRLSFLLLNFGFCFNSISISNIFDYLPHGETMGQDTTG